MKIRYILATAAVLTTGAVFGVSPSASAWPWSGQVTVQGNATCHDEHASVVTIGLNNGESSGAVPNNYGTYSLTFFRIPSGGVWGTAGWRAPLAQVTCTRSVFISRPTVGSTQYLTLDG